MTETRPGPEAAMDHTLSAHPSGCIIAVASGQLSCFDSSATGAANSVPFCLVRI
jgi:hypothetical protein